MFLGQVHTETGGFTAKTESLNYAYDSPMMRKFISWGRISDADARKFGRTADHPAHQNALANILYGGDWGRKNLGNTQPGDGWKFRGRGGKQLTGRANYRKFSRAWLGDESLLENPDRVAQPDGWVASAIHFWKSNGLNEVADRGTVDDVTKIVNGGTVGLSDRKSWTLKYAGAWSVK